MVFSLNTAGDKLVTRFRLEPRAAYRTGGCWLVAFDLQQGDYIKQPGTRKYMTFANSECAWSYLRTIL